MSTKRPLAVAGCGGFIGSRIAAAAGELGLPVYGFDPALTDPPPTITMFDDEEGFYNETPEATLYHLALHPWARKEPVAHLLRRAAAKKTAILMEKPMATPEDPEECSRLIELIDQSAATVLFNFPELFDPLTWKIIEFLRQFRSVTFTEFRMERTKDRETDTPRNKKITVPIQHQETVHCLAFVLYILGTIRGSFNDVVKYGLSASANSAQYWPPNPEDYSYVVDGYCGYGLRIDGANVNGITSFSKGAIWSKRKQIFGTADGQKFHIDAEHLPGKMYLCINGQDQGIAENSSTHQAMILRINDWLQSHSREELHSGLFPHCRFAQMTYALSSMLWKSSFDQKPVAVGNLEELLAFDSGFAAALPNFEKY